MSETQSKESILEDPLDQTLDDTDQDWDDVLKPQNQKKRCKAIIYELYQPFQEYDQIVKQIKEGNINGNNWIFKNKDGDKYRYYCKFNKQGCRVALYLQLTSGSCGNCFFSDEEHKRINN